MSTQKYRSSTRRSKRSSRSIPSRDLVTKKALSGGRFSPPTNPPDVTYMPWFPTTLVISFSNKLEFKVNSVRDYLKAQLDPTKRGFNQQTSGDGLFVVQYRLVSIETWNLTGRVIALAVDDFTDSVADAGARDQLCGLVDTGTTTHTPCVGYKLPHAHQHHVLRTDSKQGDMNLFDVTTSNGQCIAYVKILWRFDGPLKHPNVVSPVEEISLAVSEISNKILKTQEPSKLELTLNGIRYVAEAVALVGSLSDMKIEHPPRLISDSLIPESLDHSPSTHDYHAPSPRRTSFSMSSFSDVRSCDEAEE